MIVRADDSACPILGARMRQQQHRSQDRDDGDNFQQFNQCEAFSVAKVHGLARPFYRPVLNPRIISLCEHSSGQEHENVVERPFWGIETSLSRRFGRDYRNKGLALQLFILP